jgi:hypothetical protein
MASLLEGTRVGHQAPSMEEYLISTNEKSLNDKSVPAEEMIKLYGFPEEVHCVAYALKRQNTEDIVIGHSTSHGHHSMIRLSALLGPFTRVSLR